LTEAIAEEKVSVNLRTTGGVDVDVHVVFRSSEHSVLVPVRLAYSQDIAGGFQLWQIGGLIRRIRDYDKNVDDGFGREAGY
jgi:hypothetical protein